MDATEHFEAFCKKHGHHYEHCNEYGEPGYSTETGIILANWNDIPEGLCNALEAMGVSLEWSDQWIIDYNHDKAWRTGPDSYGWTPSTRVTDDGELLTPDDDIEDWIHHCGMIDRNNPARAMGAHITHDDLINAGFTLAGGEHETGLHPGQNSDPNAIAGDLLERDDVGLVVFLIRGVGQFDMQYASYVRAEGL